MRPGRHGSGRRRRALNRLSAAAPLNRNKLRHFFPRPGRSPPLRRSTKGGSGESAAAPRPMRRRDWRRSRGRMMQATTPAKSPKTTTTATSRKRGTSKFLAQWSDASQYSHPPTSSQNREHGARVELSRPCEALPRRLRHRAESDEVLRFGNQMWQPRRYTSAGNRGAENDRSDRSEIPRRDHCRTVRRAPRSAQSGGEGRNSALWRIGGARRSRWQVSAYRSDQGASTQNAARSIGRADGHLPIAAVAQGFRRINEPVSHCEDADRSPTRPPRPEQCRQGPHSPCSSNNCLSLSRATSASLPDEPICANSFLARLQILGGGRFIGHPRPHHVPTQRHKRVKSTS
jgi:hypothetical protein